MRLRAISKTRFFFKRETPSFILIKVEGGMDFAPDSLESTWRNA